MIQVLSSIISLDAILVLMIHLYLFMAIDTIRVIIAKTCDIHGKFSRLKMVTPGQPKSPGDAIIGVLKGIGVILDETSATN